MEIPPFPGVISLGLLVNMLHTERVEKLVHTSVTLNKSVLLSAPEIEPRERATAFTVTAHKMENVMS